MKRIIPFDDIDPITLFHSLMEGKGLKAKNLVEILGVSKRLVSDILNYRKGLSKEVIRNFAEYFKVSQEAFNRTYELKFKIPRRSLTEAGIASYSPSEGRHRQP